MTETQKAAALFSGKTVQMVDALATNVWTFYFTDGTNAVITTDGRPLSAKQLYDDCLVDPFKE